MVRQVCRGRRRGFMIALVVMAILAFGLLIFSFSKISQGNRLRVTHLSKAQSAYHISSSVLAKVQADLHATGWAGRPFKDAPFRQSSFPLHGGEYDLHVEDAPGKEFQFDIYVRTRFSGLTRLFFWRVAYRDDLLDIANRPLTIIFTSPPEDKFPSGVGTSPFASIVEDLLEKRARNEDKALDLGALMAGLGNIRDILGIFGAGAGINATNTAEFADVGRLAIPISQVATLPADPLPSRSDGKGIRPGTDGSGYGYDSTSDKAEQAAESAAASAQTAQAAANEASQYAGASPQADTAVANAQAAAAHAEAAAATAAQAAADAAAIAAGTAHSGAYQSAAEATQAAVDAAAEAAAAAAAAEAAAAEAKAAAEAAAAAEAGVTP